MMPRTVVSEELKNRVLLLSIVHSKGGVVRVEDLKDCVGVTVRALRTALNELAEEGYFIRMRVESSSNPGREVIGYKLVHSRITKRLLKMYYGKILLKLSSILIISSAILLVARLPVDPNTTLGICLLLTILLLKEVLEDIV